MIGCVKAMRKGLHDNKLQVMEKVKLKRFGRRDTVDKLQDHMNSALVEESYPSGEIDVSLLLHCPFVIAQQS